MGCNTSSAQINPTTKPVSTSLSVWCCNMILAVPSTPAISINRDNHHTGLYPKRALKETTPPTMPPMPSMCSLSFHFKFSIIEISIISKAVSMMPDMYQGIFSFLIISIQNT